MKKLVMTGFILVLFTSLAFGAEIEKSSINIIVDSKGTSRVEETFLVSFSDQNEMSLFKQTLETGTLTDILETFEVNVLPRLDNRELTISFEEQEENIWVKLNYFSDSLFVINIKTTFDAFSLDKQKFSFLFSEDKLSLPENFSLRFVLPGKAKINENMVPKTKIVSKTIEWKGPLTDKDLFLSYSIEKTPGPVQIKKTRIEITVRENGFAGISEEYLFEFRDEEELQYFLGISEKNGSSLLSWTTFDKRFFPHISANEYDVKNASVEFVPNGLYKSYLSIVYENESPIFIEQKERNGRFVEWSLNPRKLDAFLSGGSIVVPEKTILEITLPLNVEIKENTFDMKGEKVVWEGYKNTSKINLVYVIKENIAPTFNLSSAIQKMVSNKETLTYIVAVLLVVSVLIYFKREKVSEKIDKFIIENSKVEEREKVEIEIED
jgi:hypothetical protein